MGAGRRSPCRQQFDALTIAPRNRLESKSRAHLGRQKPDDRGGECVEYDYDTGESKKWLIVTTAGIAVACDWHKKNPTQYSKVYIDLLNTQYRIAGTGYSILGKLPLEELNRYTL